LRRNPFNSYQFLKAEGRGQMADGRGQKEVEGLKDYGKS
jgi:hypothetical protein